jgi:hypothetical protein
MAAFGPFQITTGPTAGRTITVVACASGILDSTGGFAPCILVGNNIGSMIWVRLTSGAGGTTATTADCPLTPNTVRLFANPNPVGQTACAVACSVTNSNAVYFCPGEGGDV